MELLIIITITIHILSVVTIACLISDNKDMLSTNLNKR